MASCFFFFFNDTATTEIYTLSLHDALPISKQVTVPIQALAEGTREVSSGNFDYQVPEQAQDELRSEEHTSELQSRLHLVCRLLLEKKKIPSHAMHLRWTSARVTRASGAAA